MGFGAGSLRWLVVVDGEAVARFRSERDAKGFARARFGDDAEVRVGDTDLELVYGAMLTGCSTSHDVSFATGMPVKQASVYLRELFLDGRLEHVGEVSATERGSRGRAMHIYRIAGALADGPPSIDTQPDKRSSDQGVPDVEGRQEHGSRDEAQR